LLFICGLIVIVIFRARDAWTDIIAIANNQQIEIIDGDTSSQSRIRIQSNNRRQLSPRPMDESLKEQYMRSYLGGLYPSTDKNKLPTYLRDTDEYTGGGSLKKDLVKRDLVYFWHIPKASGSTMKNIMNFCFDLRRAEQLESEPSMEYVRNNILNHDTTSPDGLQIAFASQLVNSNKLDIVVSNYFLSGAALFTDIHYGKAFTILRHPVELAISLFFYRRKATWERSYRPAWTKLTFHEFVTSEHYMDNWMVRQLTGTMPWEELNESHLEHAKLIMKEKIFVGLLIEMDETIRQLKSHFGWVETKQDCANNYLHSKPTNQNDHPDIAQGGPTWNVVMEKDKWDMMLYYYGIDLFAEQRNRYPPKPAVGGDGPEIDPKQ